jgi:6-phosphogluconolactonase
MHNVKVLQDALALYRAAAEEFSRCARESIEDHRRFCVALSGGSTPHGVYSLLAERPADLPWNKIFVFFGDERHVPPDHPDNNYRMAQEALLSKIPIPAANVFRIRAELDANQAAQEYEDQLRSFFALRPGESPRFDLIMLGLGDDGHTASLFPGSAALSETSRLVVANWVEKFQQYRITLTYPMINHAAEVMFLVSGSGKAQILKDVLSGEGEKYPAQRVWPENGVLLWMVDQDAARFL